MMTRSILPSFLRSEASPERLCPGRKVGQAQLPPAPSIDPWTAWGVSLVELARMAQEVAS